MKNPAPGEVARGSEGPPGHLGNGGEGTRKRAINATEPRIEEFDPFERKGPPLRSPLLQNRAAARLVYTWCMMELGPLFWIFDRLQGFQQTRRRVRVVVHRGVFLGRQDSPLYYFVKVTNLSQARDIEITHVWFDADPPVTLLMPERPLPTRLRPDETWEGWVEAAALTHVSNVERSGRVLLANGKTVRSRWNKNIPPRGYVAGRGTPSG